MKKILAVLGIAGLSIFGAVNKNVYALGDLVPAANNGTYTTIQKRSIQTPLVYGDDVFHFLGVQIGPTTEYFYGTTTAFGTMSPSVGAVDVSGIYDSKLVFVNVGSCTSAGSSTITIYGAVGTMTPTKAWFVIGTQTVTGTSSVVIDVSNARCDWISTGVRPSVGTPTFDVYGRYTNFKR